MKREKLPTGFWVTFAFGMVWCLYRALANQAWILDDELSHYLISKDVWIDPKELWHTWSRPGRNIIQVIPSYFGIEAARLWTLCLAGLTVWLAGREGRSLQLGMLWALPILIIFQWWFPELSYPVLTQTPFMVVWFLGVYLARRKHLVWAALCWGYLPLIRHEGIALSGLWGLWVIFGPGGFAKLLLKRKWREARPAFFRASILGIATFVPMSVMNVMTWSATGVWPVEMLFDSKPTDYYGSGPIWLYLQHMLYGAGVPVVLFLFWGLFRPWKSKDWSMVLYWTYPAYLIMHSLIYWKGLFASGGYYHFIMPMAPWIGLVALKGLEGLRERFGIRAVAISLVLTVYGGLLMLQQQWVNDSHINGMPKVKSRISWVIAPPMTKSRFGRGLENAANWLQENIDGQNWISHHVAVSYCLEDHLPEGRLDPWDRYQADSEELIPGTILAWDSQYSVDTFGFTEESLAKADWEEVERWAHGTVRIYRKK
ncbi:MAG: hypothetical protein PVJ98_07020 [Akkermansiaceae bacterium]|jgi:hypothetical protein